MSLYSYRLHKDIKEEKPKNTYKERDLRLMNTFQLREICSREKLVKSIVNPLDKEELISLIMKYRGEKEKLLINRHLIGGFERIERFLKRSRKDIINAKNIDYPSKITLYGDLAVGIYDNYRVNFEKDMLDESNVLLVDENYKVCSIFNIKKVVKNNECSYFLIKSDKIQARESESRHYNMLFFDEKNSDAIYNTYEGDDIFVESSISFMCVPVLEVDVRNVEEAERPLAIDFGTCNTTAGIYINKEVFSDFHRDIKKEEYEEDNISLLKILNENKGDAYYTPLIPSIVGIKKLEENYKTASGTLDKQNNDYVDSENRIVKYIFGYEALAESKKRYVDDNLTVFYDIKRWISDFEKYEKVIDIDGKTGFVQRKNIIKAYLEHIISLADSYFKCRFKNIYISCPSKQKYKFHSLFKEILSDYNVQSDNMLEENAAVLYNTIYDLIRRKKYEENVLYKALIIDCGGGTTDLSGCTFRIKNNRVSYEVDIETSYENGDTDFGGNNLTFRILQFIKILMADVLNGYDGSIKKAIIDEFNIDIFRYVDKYGIDKLYEILDEEYERAENVIPTKFKLYEGRSREDYCKVRSNYYFLWNLAEETKKVFFENPEILKIVLSSSESEDKESINIRYDKWKLSYINNGEFIYVKEGPEVVLTTYEITTILKGDIYNIIKKFLEKLYENDELYDYSLIKLTGQSCKVDVFKDALKEFIPGRIIEVNKSRKSSVDEYELKLSCIKGALKYLYSRNFGYADISIRNNVPLLPYVVTAYTHTGEEKVLIKGRKINKGSISRFMDKIILKIYLKDNEENVKYVYDYTFKKEEMEKVDSRTIGERYPNINQHETDNIENNEIKFFVWAEEEMWGFYVLAVLREDHELYIGKEKLYYFENDEWEKNFFDGMN
ncbi:MAG: molecular chaperone [Clostridium sp.]